MLNNIRPRPRTLIEFPKYVSLDTATLGRLSKDLSSREKANRQEARRFVDQMSALNCFLVITFTHLCELFRHSEDQTVRGRFRFLEWLPMVAWPRPYDRSWFVGSIVEIGRRELHAFVHDGARGALAVRNAARSDLWETGVGQDIFRDNDEFWLPLIHHMRQTTEHDRYIASFSTTDPQKVSQMRIDEARRDLLIPAEELPHRTSRLARHLAQQVARRGDKRLDRVPERAVNFAIETRERVQTILTSGEDFVLQICKQHGIPESLVSDEMTVGNLGELGVLSGKLETFARGLNPPADVNLSTVPPGSLPTLTFDRMLLEIQQKANRVSGSDLSDGHLAALSMYADVIEVDRRTYEYVSQIRRQSPDLDKTIGAVVKSSDYRQLIRSITCALQ